METPIIIAIILLISSLITAVYNLIDKFVIQPKKLMKDRKSRNEEEDRARAREEFQAVLPDFLREYETQNYGRWVQDASQITIDKLEPILEEIRDLNKEQSKIIETLQQNAVDRTRQEITKIYYRYKDMRQIPRYIRENLDELYGDYIRLNGNHYVEKIYKRMILWEVVDLDDDYDDIKKTDL